MLDDNRVGLSPPRSPMSNCIQGSFHSIGCESGLIVVVDTNPPKSDGLKFFL